MAQMESLPLYKVSLKNQYISSIQITDMLRKKLGKQNHSSSVSAKCSARALTKEGNDFYSENVQKKEVETKRR